MTWKIEIATSEVKQYSGTSQATGKPYSFRKQEAWLHVPGQKYPQRFEIMLPDELPNGYQPGLYTLAPDALWINRRGNLVVTPRLAPMAAPADAKKGAAA